MCIPIASVKIVSVEPNSIITYKNIRKLPILDSPPLLGSRSSLLRLIISMSNKLGFYSSGF